MFTFSTDHKKMDIVKGNDVILFFYMDDDGTIYRQKHEFTVLSGTAVANTDLSIGMTSEVVTLESASGTWDDRYTLDYQESHSK